MGRKKRAAKAEAMANVSDNFNPPLETFGPQPITQTRSSNLYSKKKASKDRSIQNLDPPPQNQEVKPIIEEINLTENEKEGEPQVDHIMSEQPLVRVNLEGKSNNEPASHERSVKGKIDYFVRTVEEFKSETTKGELPQGSFGADINYMNLYIDSQKKIQDLTKQNHEIVKALTFNLEKIEAYEKIMMVSDLLGRASETVMNASPPQVILGCPEPIVDPKTSPANKRKRPSGNKKN